MIHQNTIKESFPSRQRVMQIFSLLYSKESQEHHRIISLRKYNESCINCSSFPQNCHSKIDTILFDNYSSLNVEDYPFKERVSNCSLCVKPDTYFQQTLFCQVLKYIKRWINLKTTCLVQGKDWRDKRTYDLESVTCQWKKELLIVRCRWRIAKTSRRCFDHWVIISIR